MRNDKRYIDKTLSAHGSAGGVSVQPGRLMAHGFVSSALSVRDAFFMPLNHKNCMGTKDQS